MLSNPSFREGGQSLLGWLDSNLDCDSEEMARAQVRDIQDTIEVIALKKIQNRLHVLWQSGGFVH